MRVATFAALAALAGVASLAGCGEIIGIHEIAPPDGGPADADEAPMDAEHLGSDGESPGADAEGGSNLVRDGGDPRDAMPDTGPPAGDAASCSGGTTDTSCGSTCENCTAGGKACHGHSNGLGQTFYDCNPLGTYDEGQAVKACAAATGSPSLCYPTTSGRCSLFNSSTVTVICSVGIITSACSCWEWTVTPGSVSTSAVGACPVCPTSSSPTWN
jgi:hypothetical protein